MSLQDFSKGAMIESNRDLFLWIDEWIEMNMEDIRKLEDEVQQELKEVSTPMCWWERILSLTFLVRQRASAI